MAETKTPRFALPQWSAGTDFFPGRTGFNTILQLLDGDAAKNLPGAAIAFPSGLSSAMPRSGTFGRFFFATNEGTNGVLYYDGGNGWVALNRIGGGGPGTAIAIGRTATVADEGTLATAARADHVHTIPFATTTNPGVITAEHYTLLSTANSTVTASMLVRRTPAGQIAVPSGPNGGTDAVCRDWVVNYAENVVGQSSYIDGGSKLVRRWNSGHVSGPDPDKPEFYATRRYVTSVASRAEWKTNARPFPYGLPEALDLAGELLLYDYQDTEGTPAAVRGNTDELGAYVEAVAEIMPLLVEDGADGAPERIKDRQLVWVLVKALGELSDAHDELAAAVHDLRSELGAVKHHLGL